MGFQFEKFGTRLAAVIAIVIFLYIRMDLVDIMENSEKLGKVKVAMMMMMMMMMMPGTNTYGTNTYRYSFRWYSVRTPLR